MASTSGAKICDLPDEVLLRIFSSLPVADLARCAATCERFHNIVTRFTSLWKDKAYISVMNPAECAETRAVLHALPPLHNVTIEMTSDFVLSVSYPYLDMSHKYIAVMKDYRKLRCNSLMLSTSVPIARDVLSFQSTIDLEGLQQLRVSDTCEHLLVSNEYSAEPIFCTVMRLCPSLRKLRVSATFFPAESLDAVQEFCQLQFLELCCDHVYKLSFLRHCSGTLEEFRLLGSSELPSQEFRELSQLQKLQRLRLTDCRFDEVDLAAAMAGLANLESLRLECCSVVRDLSVLQHCGRLRELDITNSIEMEDDVIPEGRHIQLRDLRLPTQANYGRDVMFGVKVTGNDLSAALRRLEELGLHSSCLAYLSAMCHCSQLRHLYVEFENRCDEEDIKNVRIYITLTGST